MLAADLSHFKLVIERLQAAQEAEADNEDSVCPTGEDEGQEEVLNTHVWTFFLCFFGHVS